MTGSALKILHVFDHSVPLMSGYSMRSLALLAAQRRMGWKTVHLTTPKHSMAGPTFEEVDGHRFHRTAPVPAYLARLPGIGEAALIRATAKRVRWIASYEKPDIIHAHSPALNAIAATTAGRKLGIPVVYEVRAFWEDAAVGNGADTEGSWRYRATRALEDSAFRRADAIVAICEGLRADIAARGMPADKIAVVPNGVALDAFPYRRAPKEELRAQLGLGGKIVLGFLGSFYPYEGLDILLDAVALLRRERPDVALLLAGGGPAEEALKWQALRLGIDDAVTFVGRVPHRRVGDYYDLVDLFVYPRRALRLTETVTPLKPLEAMARGGVVLASDVGGHRELVRHGENGLLFPADDAKALARTLDAAIARRGQWPALGRAARDFVERERSWDRAAEGYLAAYSRALGRPVTAKPTSLPRRGEVA
ncbi:MAG TPA: TIGR04063 family PEP-CTERM/XrtA system glycosyltransferase [Stellaceae bacterium]|nr:TIGR04063 family PEP-CTERM/XrtA system glycosyltransferase [Stellaceae bacterium]